MIEGTASSRSSVVFDLDDDGDLDIVTNEINDRPQIFISDLAQRKKIHFLKVKLVGTRSNRDGLGAIVSLTAGGRQTQQHDGKSGYLSLSSFPLYFGLRRRRRSTAWKSPGLPARSRFSKGSFTQLRADDCRTERLTLASWIRFIAGLVFRGLLRPRFIDPCRPRQR